VIINKHGFVFVLWLANWCFLLHCIECMRRRLLLPMCAVSVSLSVTRLNSASLCRGRLVQFLPNHFGLLLFKWLDENTLPVPPENRDLVKHNVFTILTLLQERAFFHVLCTGVQFLHKFGYFCQSWAVVVSHVGKACEVDDAAELIFATWVTGISVCRVLCVM